MQDPTFFTHSSFDLGFTAKQLHGIGHAAIDPHILRRKSGGSMYIHERKEWPPFIWGEAGQSGLLAEVRHEQGRLLGLMGSFGFGTREEVSLRVLTQDAVNTAEIEGETYNPRSVRSSIARAIADIQTDVCFNPKPKLVNRRLRSDRRGGNDLHNPAFRTTCVNGETTHPRTSAQSAVPASEFGLNPKTEIDSPQITQIAQMIQNKQNPVFKLEQQ